MRKFAGNVGRAFARPGGDMEDYLTRKLQRVSDEIDTSKRINARIELPSAIHLMIPGESDVLCHTA